MTLRPGIFVAGASGGVAAPQDARLAKAGELSGPGILSGGLVTGSTSGPNMQYTIAAGVFVTARAAASDGVYEFANDGALNADSGAPAPSSGTRWDLIWVRHQNAIEGGTDSTSLPLSGVLVGVAGSSPIKPYGAGQGVGGTSLPAGALVIAESQVGTNIANASLATITQVAPKAAARGGILPVTGSSQYPTTPRAGDYVYDASLDCLVRWNGSAWIPGRLQWQYKKSDTPTIPTGAGTKFVMNTLVIDTAGLGLTSGACKVPVAGTYRVSGSATFAASATGRRGAWIAVNPGATPPPIDGTETLIPANSSGITCVPVAASLIPCNANDVIALIGYQDSGSSLAVGMSQLTVELT